MRRKGDLRPAVELRMRTAVERGGGSGVELVVGQWWRHVAPFPADAVEPVVGEFGDRTRRPCG
jgi:hypothetical protein